MKIIIVKHEVAEKEYKTYLVVEDFEHAEKLFHRYHEFQMIKTMELLANSPDVINQWAQ